MASPTRYQASPSPTAEIRSQAIAKLKRAASNPRTAGRPLVHGLTSSANTSEEGHNSSSAEGHSAAPSPIKPNHYDYDDEELLANDGSGLAAETMQRAASDSSSLHIPTPPLMGFGSSSGNSPFYSAQASPVGPGADWPTTAYPHGLSPISVPPSSFPQSLTPTGMGRNTPSPLPTLGELRNLSRSNSAAARAKAMCKLTGQPVTPTRSTNFPTPMSSDEDVTFGGLGSRLTRSGTIGVPRMFGLIGHPVDDTAAILPPAPIPDTAFDIPRPRLQRSFTVSSSNMGEERRSAVGRRMVERLASRRANRQEEEADVRKLWEERRREVGKSTDTWGTPRKSRPVTEAPEDDQAEQFQDVHESFEDAQDVGITNDHSLRGEEDEELGDQDWSRMAQEDGIEEMDDGPILPPPSANSGPITSSADQSPARRHQLFAAGGLMAGGVAAAALAAGGGDRTPSRNTERSDEFEYEAHLRRSMSSRTARAEFDGSPEKALPAVPALPSSLIEDHSVADSIPGAFPHDPAPPSQGDSGALAVPVQPFATASRHAPQASVSSDSTVLPPDNSPSSHSPTISEPPPPPEKNTPTLIPGFPLAENSLHEKSERALETPISHNDSQTSFKDAHSTLGAMSPVNETPTSQTPTNHAQQDSITSLTSAGSQDRAASRMSWDDLEKERETLAMAPPPKKSTGSLSGRRGRAMLAALRKHSGTSQPNSPPASPRNAFTGVFGRRDSDNTTQRVPSQRGRARDNSDRTKPEGPPSAFPSINTDTTSANNRLLQHQLSNSPSPVSFLPRANAADPRVLNSKLSPFPGINVTTRSRAGSDSQEQVPKSAQPALESVRARPTNGSTSRAAQRVSDENSSSGSVRRNWLGKPITTRTSGANSDNHSRQGSNSSEPSHISNRSQPSHPSSRTPSEDYRNGSIRQTDSPMTDGDYSAMDSSTDNFGIRGGKARPEIPSFMMHRRRAPPPPMALENSNVESISDEPQAGVFAPMPPRSVAVLSRMDEMLSGTPGESVGMDFLDDPPRKLLLSQQVLQVVNLHTVKDRYLFLFNDILVIAKPVISQGTTATLDMKFIVKSVVSLDKLTVSGIAEEPSYEAARHPAVHKFVECFAEDGPAAVRSLVERSATKADPATLASLLFKTAELDKSQLGGLLATDHILLRAFMDRFHFRQVRIDDALRMFLLAIRLPTDIGAAETLLRGFADGYFNANHDHVPYDLVRARDLVLATLELNDMLYSTFGFAFPNHAISAETFVSAFRSKDPNGLVPDSLLEDVYSSIQTSKLVQALALHESHLAREVTLTPTRFPSKLTFNEWSELITASIPRADPSFKVKLLGEGLEFDPPTLDFSQSKDQSFRIRGVSLGAKSMLFDRVGSNAALYASLGITRSFNVERLFMRHTFQVSFMSHLDQKRKYCFSVPDASSRQRWGQMLTRQVWLTTEKKQGAGAPTTPEQRVRRAAEAVGLQVLRDALLPPASKLDKGGLDSTPVSRKTSQSTPHREHHLRGNRMGSVSVAYAHKYLNDESASPVSPLQSGKTQEAVSGMVDLQTGKELVLLCRQNSLLPTVLELLQSGTEPLTAVSSIPSSIPSSITSGIPLSAQLQNTPQPLRSAGLKAQMHDRRL